MLKHPTSFSLFKTNILLFGGGTDFFIYLSISEHLGCFHLGGLL